MAKVLSTEKRAAIVKALVEGCSIRATSRMVGVSRNTVTKLLGDLAEACIELHELKVRNLPCKRVQCDEIWSFVGKKAKNVRGDEDDWVGDVWTYTAICADSKLCASWLVGARDAWNAELFMRDLEARLAERVQLTTDGHQMYLEAVDRAFGADGVDYAMLQKQYGADPEPQKRYSPAKCTGTKRIEIRGEPAPEHINTSYVERQNLTMRMSMRRFTRLTNAFSKKVENHAAAVAIHFAYYNFCRPHQSLRTERNNRVTPAMAAGVTDRQWAVEDLLSLLPEVEHKGGRPSKG